MRSLAICFSLSLSFFACSDSQKTDRSALIDQYLLGQLTHYRFNGNVLIAENGKVVYQKSYGLRDFSSNQPLNDSSIFELASVTKQFTAMGILLLEQQGKLSLQDSLRKFLPELPYVNVTLRQMLTHTAGLPDYEAAFREKWDKNRIAFNSDLVAFLASEKPSRNFVPGARWEYSNTAYALLASIIEKASGMTYADFLMKNIFDPLGMNHTQVYSHRALDSLSNYASGFVWSDNQYALPDSLPGYEFVRYQAGIVGDGGLCSTTGDLLTWINASKDEKLFGTLFQKMSSPYAVSDSSRGISYGYGFFVGKNHLGSYVSHPGYWPGYETVVANYTDGDRTIIILSNNEAPSRFIGAALANILYGQPVTLPYAHQRAPVDSVTLDAFTGAYSFNGWDFTLERRGDTLFQVFGPGYGRVYLPESDTKVFPVDGQDIQFEIEKGPQGDVKHFVVVYGVREEMRQPRRK